MKILLIGASGMIGSRILKEAVLRSHQVCAAARDISKIATESGVTPVALDINDPTAILPIAQDMDLVICAVSPRNSGDAVADAIQFTQSLISVCHQSGNRLLMVGGGSSLYMPDGTSALALTPEAILPEATGMRKAYAMLVSADINFAVLAPGGMIAPGERTGQFRLAGRTMLTNSEGGKGNISAEDYAIAMLDEAEQPRHFGTIFNVSY